MALTRTGTITCPYCGESFDVTLDPAEGQRQDWFIDCEVCCRPMRVAVRLGRRPGLETERAD